ncbi:hypothetical protein RB653_001483 [Dictyostelium firmibasis]|uniref:Uncharacterized protein n=1 Tax=Dictyostelium firmibasis TaxID=79012 RepID=A0AAN7Z251_9MYCE
MGTDVYAPGKASSSWRKLALVTGKRYKKNFITFERLLDRTIDNITTATSSNITNQIVISDTSTKRDVCRVVSIKRPESKDDATNEKNIGGKPAVSVVKEFIQESTIKSLSWWNDSMVAGSNDGHIYYYQNDPTTTDDPELRETFVHTKLKGFKESVSQTIGSMGFNTSIKAVAINQLSTHQFSSLENNYYHIWDFSDAVRPTISFKVSEQPVYCSQWSPHSRNYSLIGGSSNSIKITDTRLLSSYSTTRKSPTVWFNNSGAIGGGSGSNNSSSYQSSVSIKDVSWHPFVPYWFASASDSGEISIWDLRSTLEPVISFLAHSSSISKIDWCPAHSELLVSSGIDGEYKFWSLLNEPHYNLFQKDETSPFVSAGFFENDGYNSFGVNQSGEVYYANVQSKFMNPIIHSKFDKKERSEKITERLIYNRDFINGFEKAITQANKHSRAGSATSLEKAKILLSLCFQQNLDDSLADVLKSTIPKVNCKKETLAEIEQYAYFIPPTFYEKFQTKLSTNLMTKIKELKVNLDIQYHIKNFKGVGDEIQDIERDVLSTLKGDLNSIRMETIVDLVEVLLGHDTNRCFQFAIQVVELFKLKLPQIMPIVRLLLHPSIFEKKYSLGDSTNILLPLGSSNTSINQTPLNISGNNSILQAPSSPLLKNNRSSSVGNSTATSPSMGRANTSGKDKELTSSIGGQIIYGNGDLEEMKLNEYLTNSDQIILQLHFMKGFLRLLNSPNPIGDGTNPNDEDIIDFSAKNRPPLILSMPIIRVYMTILFDMFIFDQFFITLLNCLNVVTDEFEFHQYLQDQYDLATPEFIEYIKNSQQRDRLKPYDTERYSTPMLTIISILYNVPPQSIPLELYEQLLQSLPMLIQEVDNSLISTIQQPDPSSGQPGKMQSSQKATQLLESIKVITTELPKPVIPSSSSSISSSIRRPVATPRPLSTNLSSPSNSPTNKISSELQTQLQNINSILNKYVY